MRYDGEYEYILNDNNNMYNTHYSEIKNDVFYF